MLTLKKVGVRSKIVARNIVYKLPYRPRAFIIRTYHKTKDSPKVIEYFFNDIAKAGLLGDTVLLEHCSMCQLKCPVCPTASGANKTAAVGWGYLKFENFKKLVDGSPEIKNIEMSNWGEIFLNPELKDIIKYAHDKGIKLTAGNGVNLNNASKEVLDHVVKYQVRHLNCSIDGATNEVYQMYRKGGDLNKVLENIRFINELKEKYNTPYPKLSWQFIIFGHNEHEIVQAKKMAEELNMTFKPKLNATHWEGVFSPVKDKEKASKESGLGVSSRDDFKEKYKRAYLLPCKQFWMSPQINWDGKLLGCCDNRWGDFGNVFEQGLDATLKGEKFVYAKQMLLGQKPARADIPCIKCPIYKEIKEKPMTTMDIIS